MEDFDPSRVAFSDEEVPVWSNANQSRAIEAARVESTLKPRARRPCLAGRGTIEG